MTSTTDTLKSLVKSCTSIKAFGTTYREVTKKAVFVCRFCCIRLGFTYRPDRFNRSDAGMHALRFFLEQFIA